jgi:hypothetical protein
MIQALIRARIPYIAVHADNIDRDANKVSLLVLPNLAAMSNSQVDRCGDLLARGGSLVATDETSLYDGYGDRRPDFALATSLGRNTQEGRTVRTLRLVSTIAICV